MPMHRFTSEGMEYQVRWGNRIVTIFAHPVGHEGAGASISMPRTAWDQVRNVKIISPGTARSTVRHPQDDDDDADRDDDEGLDEDEIVNTLKRLSHRMPDRPSEDILRRLGPVLVYNEGWREGIREALKLVTTNMSCGASVNDDRNRRLNCDLKRNHDGLHEHAMKMGKLMWSSADPTHSESYPVIKRS